MKDPDMKMIILLPLLAGMILLLPYTLRAINGNPYIINSETYYFHRIYYHETSGHDSLIKEQLPLNILFTLPKSDIFLLLITRILPFLLGMAVIFIGFLILQEYNISERNIYAILILLMISPIFIYIFSDFNPYNIIVFLTLLSLYMMIKRHSVISVLLLAFIPFIEIYSAMIISLFMIIYFIVNRKNIRNWKIILPIIIASLSLAIIINSVSGYDIIRSFPLEKSNIIIDVGADIGYSFSALIMSLIGLILLWDKGWKNLVLYLTIILGLLIAVFNSTIRIYLNFILVVYGGFAFIYLIRRKWSIQIIKKVTLLLIVCSILFSSILYITQMIKSAPDADYVDAMNFIKGQALPGEKVLSSRSNGFMIEYYSGVPAFLDGHTMQNAKHIININDNISLSRNLENTESMLADNNIRYIFIDEEYMQYLTEKEGLLFLIETSNKFKDIYHNDKITVWMYLGSTSQDNKG